MTLNLSTLFNTNWADLKTLWVHLWALTSSCWLGCFVESDRLILMLILILALFTDWGRTLTRRIVLKVNASLTDWMKSPQRRELVLIYTSDQ